MWNTSIPKGKIPYVPTWNLNCKISPVITVGQDVFPGSCFLDFGQELQNFDNFEITVLYDQHTLYQGPFVGTAPIVIESQLLDDKENTDHVLCIGLQGKTDDHSCFYQGKSVSLGIQIDLSIEDMPLNLNLMVSGIKTILGENSLQSFCINTPIYRWLLKNQEHIMADLIEIYKQ